MEATILQLQTELNDTLQLNNHLKAELLSIKNTPNVNDIAAGNYVHNIGQLFSILTLADTRFDLE